MRIFFLISALMFPFLSQGWATPLSGDNATFMLNYSDIKGTAQATIKRGPVNIEKLIFTPHLDSGGLIEMDFAALNAILASGKTIEVPAKFNSAEELQNFASAERRKFQDEIKDPEILKTYIFNLRMVGTNLLARARKCETVHAATAPGRTGTN